MEVFIGAILAGVNLAFAGLTIFIYTKNSTQKQYLYFGSFSFFSGLYFLFLSLSSITQIDLFLPAIICAGIYYSIFPWFVSNVTGVKSRILYVFPIIFTLAVLTLVIRPSDPEPPLWQIIAHLGLLGLMPFLIISSISAYKKRIYGWHEFLMLTVIFVVLATEEIITYYSGVPLLSKYTFGIYPLDIYPILFTIVMGFKISQDVIDKMRLRAVTAEKDLEIERLKLKEAKQHQLETELNYKRKDLTDLSIELIRKKEFTQKIHEKLRELKSNLSNGQIGAVNEILAMTSTDASIDKGLEHMIENIDKVNHEFMSKVKTNYPSLTENELHLVSLLRLNLTIKEIASIKAIAPNSVKVLQYRLRKKINLDSKTSLRQFFFEME